jgi:hypothetical protein
MLLISASQVARIIGIKHCTQLKTTLICPTNIMGIGLVFNVEHTPEKRAIRFLVLQI